MTVTIPEFAKHLLAQTVHYYWSNKTAHCRVLPDGRVRYWTNWEGDISREFASLESLLANSPAYLPDAPELAAVSVGRAAQQPFPRFPSEGQPALCASVGIEREDGDFAVLGTLNNTDNLMNPEDFLTILRTLARDIAAATAEPVRAFERQDAPDYVTLDGSERLIVESTDATPTRSDTLSVGRIHLRAILDYLHDSEADHYDPDTYPDDVNEHVYSHVLAIEAELKAIGTVAQEAAQTFPALAPPFALDADESGDGYLTIDVAQRASIVINASPEGIVVDVYNPSREGDPLGSTWVHASDLDEAQDGAEVQS
ncbi:MAG: hypothetical protein JNL45_18025 [Hyphomicrobium sp.]|nr:hypothetical protein [Hyphomicrobium sp.]